MFQQQIIKFLSIASTLIALVIVGQSENVATQPQGEQENKVEDGDKINGVSEEEVPKFMDELKASYEKLSRSTRLLSDCRYQLIAKSRML